jgi:hypothetical protein
MQGSRMNGSALARAQVRMGARKRGIVHFYKKNVKEYLSEENDQQTTLRLRG